MNPSDLPWWGWLLCAVVAWTVSAIAVKCTEGKGGSHETLAGTIFILFGLAGLLAALIGIVRLVKWVWSG
jgi:hypothetical protein